MLLIFSTLELIRNLWQLKTAVLLHWCLIRALPLTKALFVNFYLTNKNRKVTVTLQTFMPDRKYRWIQISGNDISKTL